MVSKKMIETINHRFQVCFVFVTSRYQAATSTDSSLDLRKNGCCINGPYFGR